MPEKEKTKPKKRIWPTLVTLTIIALLVALAISFLPRSLPTDFSVVGKGRNAVVLIYDPNILQSNQITSAMNAVIDDYRGQVEFIVVQLGSPTGRMLSNRYGVETAVLLFFDGDGEMLQILHSSQDAASLQHNLNMIFKLEN